jgi:hypothetical protein
MHYRSWPAVVQLPNSASAAPGSDEARSCSGLVLHSPWGKLTGEKPHDPDRMRSTMNAKVELIVVSISAQQEIFDLTSTKPTPTEMAAKMAHCVSLIVAKL